MGFGDFFENLKEKVKDKTKDCIFFLNRNFNTNITWLLFENKNREEESASLLRKRRPSRIEFLKKKFYGSEKPSKNFEPTRFTDIGEKIKQILVNAGKIIESDKKKEEKNFLIKSFYNLVDIFLSKNNDPGDWLNILTDRDLDYISIKMQDGNVDEDKLIEFFNDKYNSQINDKKKKDDNIKKNEMKKKEEIKQNIVQNNFIDDFIETPGGPSEDDEKDLSFNDIFKKTEDDEKDLSFNDILRKWERNAGGLNNSIIENTYLVDYVHEKTVRNGRYPIQEKQYAKHYVISAFENKDEKVKVPDEWNENDLSLLIQDFRIIYKELFDNEKWFDINKDAFIYDYYIDEIKKKNISYSDTKDKNKRLCKLKEHILKKIEKNVEETDVNKKGVNNFSDNDENINLMIKQFKEIHSSTSTINESDVSQLYSDVYNVCKDCIKKNKNFYTSIQQDIQKDPDRLNEELKILVKSYYIKNFSTLDSETKKKLFCVRYLDFLPILINEIKKTYQKQFKKDFESKYKQLYGEFFNDDVIDNRLNAIIYDYVISGECKKLISDHENSKNGFKSFLETYQTKLDSLIQSIMNNFCLFDNNAKSFAQKNIINKYPELDNAINDFFLLDNNEKISEKETVVEVLSNDENSSQQETIVNTNSELYELTINKECSKNKDKKSNFYNLQKNDLNNGGANQGHPREKKLIDKYC